MGDINPRDNEDMTPVHCAAQFGRAKHIALLNEGSFLLLHTASVPSVRNVPALLILLSVLTADADVTAVDIEGKTALHWTVNNPDSSSILALVEAYPPLTSKR